MSPPINLDAGSPRRNVPNCRPVADGGMRKCSAGAWSPAGVRVGRGSIRRANSLYQATTPAFPTLAYRRQPASAIAMKACPGLRSGIDRSGSLSFAIRGIPSSIRPPIRHSGEGRNPGGVGRGTTTGGWNKTDISLDFHPLMRASQDHGDSSEGWNPEGVGRGAGTHAP